MADNQKNIRRCLINVFVKLKHRQKTTVQKNLSARTVADSDTYILYIGVLSTTRYFGTIVFTVLCRSVNFPLTNKNFSQRR